MLGELQTNFTKDAVMITEQEARAAAKEMFDDQGQPTPDGMVWFQSEAILAQWAIQELSRCEADDAILATVNEFLDDIGVPSTASGGEGDAEVKVNIYERLRMARRLLTRIP